MHSTTSREYSGFDFITKRKTWDEKKKNDFEWCERTADYYDNYHDIDTDWRDKYIQNCNLFQGRGDHLLKSEFSPDLLEDISEEGINLQGFRLKHHDVISQVAHQFIGEQRKRPLQMVVKDLSDYTANQRKRKKQEMLQQYLKSQIVDPMQTQVAQQYLQQLGVKDLSQLSPEQQKQVQQDIQKRVSAKTPPEIKKYMSKSFRSTAEIQAQQLWDYLEEAYDFKFMTDENFKNFIIGAIQIYYVGMRHGDLVFDNVNPKGFKWENSPNNMWIQDSQWASYEENVQYMEVFSRYADGLTEEHYEKLEDNFLRFVGGPENCATDQQDAELVSVVSRDPRKYGAEGIDLKSEEGQARMQRVLQRYGSEFRSSAISVRTCHFTWKALRRLRRIKRQQSWGVDTFWVDESYRYAPEKGDFEEEIVWLPEVWETTKIGNVDCIYVNKRPVPYQYRSPEDPYYVQLPYIGMQYGKLMGNARPASPVDRGKPWQYKFNVHMQRLEEKEATDIGRVQFMIKEMIPKNWTLGKFLAVLRYGKIGMISSSKLNEVSQAAQVFKAEDLSNIQDISASIQLLEFLKNQVALAMFFNPSRLGQIGQYTAVQNNRQNIIQSSNQTEDIFSAHNKVIEKVANSLINTARIAYKDDRIKKTHIFDDMSRAELDLDMQMLNRMELGVKVVSDVADFQNLQNVKMQLQQLMSNGMLSFPEFIKISWANSGGELLEIAEEAQRRMEENQQAQQQHELQRERERYRSEQAMAEAERKLKQHLQNQEIAKDLAIGEMQSEQFAKQHDINENEVNDAYERLLRELQYKVKKDAEDRKLEREKMEKEKELTEKELETKKEIEKKKMKTDEKIARQKKSSSE